MSSDDEFEPMDASTRSALAEPSFDSAGETRTKPVVAPNDPSLDVTPTPFVPELERYRFIRLLGSGGMGQVWLAYDKKLKRNVAIKFMLKSAERSAVARARFESESAVLAQLKHANVIEVYDAGEAKGLLFFSMEYLDGKSLHERRDEFRTRAADTAEVICGVLEGLAHAHQRGIYHRDIKPANVLLRGRVPVLSDFGVAKWTEADMTMTDAILGTASHMAPEVPRAGAKDYQARTDVFSVGVILYTLLSGELPFPVIQPPNSLIKLPDHSREPKGVREHPKPVPGVDDQLERVVRKALAKDPQFRYQSADEMRADLEAWRAGQPVSAPKKTPRKRNWWPWVAAAVALLACGGITLAMVMQKKEEPVKEDERSIAERVNAGEKVVLVDGEGRLKEKFSKVAGFVGACDTHATESALSLDAAGLMLVSFDTAGLTPPYRIRADVHHAVENHWSELGIYALHSAHPDGRHAVYTNTFRGQFHTPPESRPHPAEATAGGRLIEPKDTDFPLSDFGRQLKPVPVRPHPNAVTDGPREYIPLVITVTAQAVTAEHAGQQIDTAPRRLLVTRGESALKAELVPVPPSVYGEGVGLVIRDASGLYRNVVIEPAR